ncbi:hypothetical protein PInf_026268 [Phytophthora infestans]|nr:hypothetical protein PInf_026389 [Phytophthora infestans]KAI9980396.1 hypothetical protein PInf_026268 [Phytophthora infestans]
MRTNFTDAQDKQIVALALEYESQHKRVEWKEVARAMRSKHSVQALENRLRALKRTAIRDIFSNVSVADVRQQAGKTDENAGEMLPAAISSVIQMIEAVHRDDVFLDVGAGLGNVAAQFAVQTIARQCLGIEKQPEVSSSKSGRTRAAVYDAESTYHGDKAGKWPKTNEDVVFFTPSVKVNKTLDNKGKDMFLSYLAQHEKKVSYGSSYMNPISANVGNVYAKLPPAGVDHAYTKRLPAVVESAYTGGELP